MNHDQDVSQILAAVKSIFPGDDVQPVSKFPSVPFGLGALPNNSIADTERVSMLRDGFITDDEIVDKFRKMRGRVQGKTERFKSEDGEDRDFPSRSRWNEAGPYSYHVSSKVTDDFKGIKVTKHLVLTISEAKAVRYLPDWWCYGNREGLTVSIGRFMTGFLDGLREYRRKQGLGWNFLVWFLEWHDSGFPHIHVIFLGSWIAPLSVLVSLWPYSEPQGVRLRPKDRYGKSLEVMTGKSVVRYLTAYLTKDLRSLSESKHERCAAFLWFFRRRLFNIRHYIKDQHGRRILFYSKHLRSDGAKKWKLVPYEKDVKDVDDVAGFEWSNLRQDLKRIAAMPVLYPEQVKQRAPSGWDGYEIGSRASGAGAGEPPQAGGGMVLAEIRREGSADLG